MRSSPKIEKRLSFSDSLFYSPNVNNAKSNIDRLPLFMIIIP